jgi:hypothetical protein
MKPVSLLFDALSCLRPAFCRARMPQPSPATSPVRDRYTPECGMGGYDGQIRARLRPLPDSGGWIPRRWRPSQPGRDGACTWKRSMNLTGARRALGGAAS